MQRRHAACNIGTCRHTPVEPDKSACVHIGTHDLAAVRSAATSSSGECVRVGTLQQTSASGGNQTLVSCQTKVGACTSARTTSALFALLLRRAVAKACSVGTHQQTSASGGNQTLVPCQTRVCACTSARTTPVLSALLLRRAVADACASARSSTPPRRETTKTPLSCQTGVCACNVGTPRATSARKAIEDHQHHARRGTTTQRSPPAGPAAKPGEHRHRAAKVTVAWPTNTTECINSAKKHSCRARQECARARPHARLRRLSVRSSAASSSGVGAPTEQRADLVVP